MLAGSLLLGGHTPRGMPEPMVDSEAISNNSRRRIQDDVNALVFAVDARLTPAELARLQQQAEAAQNAHHEGLVFAQAVEQQAEQVLLRLEPVDPGIVRLDYIVLSLLQNQQRLEPSLAAALCYAVGILVDIIHQSGGLHGRLGPQSVLLTPAGSVALIGCGQADLDALSFGAHNPLDRMAFESPERLVGGPASHADDVYSLAVLYYTLLAGRLPRSSTTPEALRLEAKQPVSLPGALPEPRTSLLRVFAQALSNDPATRFPGARALAEAIEGEREASGLPPAQPNDVTLLLQTTLDASCPQGGAAVLAPAAAPLVLAQANPAGWSGVLQSEDLPASRPASASGASVPSPSAEIQLPVPGDPGPSSGPTVPAPAAGLSLPGARKNPGADRGPGLLAPTQSPLSSLGVPSTKVRGQLGTTVTEGTSIRLSTLITLGVGLVVVVGLGYALMSRDGPSESENHVKSGPPQDAVIPPPAIGPVPPPPPPPLPKPQRKPPEAVRQVDLLTVMSQPSGAVVEIDGGYVGVTPLVLKHSFEQRVYQVRVTKNGFRPWEKSEVPSEGGRLSLTIVLEPQAN